MVRYVKLLLLLVALLTQDRNVNTSLETKTTPVNRGRFDYEITFGSYRIDGGVVGIQTPDLRLAKAAL